jgi:hypothetical protein
MGYIRHGCPKRLADILNALGGNANYLSEKEASYKCIEELERLVKDVGIPQTLAGSNIPESALESLTQDGLLQKRLLSRSPLPLLEEDIRAIYRSDFRTTASICECIVLNYPPSTRSHSSPTRGLPLVVGRRRYLSCSSRN